MPPIGAAAGCWTAYFLPARAILFAIAVVANPNLIGQTVKFPILVSDDADLYLKGYGTQIVREKGRGIATPSGTSGEITVTSSTNDFAGELANIKRTFSRLARGERTEAARLRLSIKELEASKAKVEKALAAARTSNAAAEVAASEQRLAQYSGEIENLVRIVD